MRECRPCWAGGAGRAGKRRAGKRLADGLPRISSLAPAAYPPGRWRRSQLRGLLRRRYPRGHWIDLLKSDEFRRYATRPELLRMELEAVRHDPERQVVIDEVQKVPALLNEVHWLMENRS